MDWLRRALGSGWTDQHFPAWVSTGFGIVGAIQTKEARRSCPCRGDAGGDLLLCDDCAVAGTEFRSVRQTGVHSLKFRGRAAAWQRPGRQRHVDVVRASVAEWG